MTDDAELIAWLKEQGFTDDEIAASPAPMLLPARRTLGDDGTYVSARQISEQAGIELDQLIRFQRAAGLPHVDDPDAAVFMTADGATATHIKRFLDLGIDPEQVLTVVRVLADGLSHTSEAMRAAALGAALRPPLRRCERQHWVRHCVPGPLNYRRPRPLRRSPPRLLRCSAR